MTDRSMTGGVVTWAEWCRIYDRIRADFGFDRDADRAARDELADLVGTAGQAFAALPRGGGRTVAVVGAAPGLEDELDVAADAGCVIAASGAATVLDGAGIEVDIVVTDLDGDPATARDLSERGSVIAVHGHGDNRSLLRDWVPSFAAGQVFPTTQVAPTDRVANVGGFTDGDRAAFLGAALGAERLVFPGWDFQDPTVSPTKAKKLRWAERLLAWLERRRGDAFAVLDGRRSGIDLAALPPADR